MEAGQGCGWPGLPGKEVSFTLEGHAGSWVTFLPATDGHVLWVWPWSPLTLERGTREEEAHLHLPQGAPHSLSALEGPATSAPEFCLPVRKTGSEWVGPVPERPPRIQNPGRPTQVPTCSKFC